MEANETHDVVKMRCQRIQTILVERIPFGSYEKGWLVGRRAARMRCASVVDRSFFIQIPSLVL